MEKIEQSQLDRIERNTLLAAKNVLQLSDVAIITGLSLSTLYRLTSRNEIPFYKPNGRKGIYFDRQEIEMWMKQDRQFTRQELDQQVATDMAVAALKRGCAK